MFDITHQFGQYLRVALFDMIPQFTSIISDIRRNGFDESKFDIDKWGTIIKTIQLKYENLINKIFLKDDGSSYKSFMLKETLRVIAKTNSDYSSLYKQIIELIAEQEYLKKSNTHITQQSVPIKIQKSKYRTKLTSINYRGFKSR